MSAELKNVLYMPSTPLNLLICLAHAQANRCNQRAKLVLIDQRAEQTNLYLESLAKLENSPFDEIGILFGKAKGWNKLVERHENFKKLVKLIDGFVPDAIAVGSDRRIEFQSIMNYVAKKHIIRPEGWYLDDGLYSYAGRPGKWYKDLVNAFIKKIVYGFWWQEPKQVGGSAWITKAWLFRPKQAIDELKLKKTYEIGGDWFSTEVVQSFSEQVCIRYGLESNQLSELKNARAIVLIPHPNNIKKMPGYEKRLFDFFSDICKGKNSIAAKYHPRTPSKDVFQLESQYGVNLVPASLAFEFVLPFFQKDTAIIGDVGTSLLTAKWLRRDLDVNAVLFDDDSFQQDFRALYERLGVNIVNDFMHLTNLKSK